MKPQCLQNLASCSGSRENSQAAATYGFVEVAPLHLGEMQMSSAQHASQNDFPRLQRQLLSRQLLFRRTCGVVGSYPNGDPHWKLAHRPLRLHRSYAIDDRLPSCAVLAKTRRL